MLSPPAFIFYKTIPFAFFLASIVRPNKYRNEILHSTKKANHRSKKANHRSHLSLIFKMSQFRRQSDKYTKKSHIERNLKVVNSIKSRKGATEITFDNNSIISDVITTGTGM